MSLAHRITIGVIAVLLLAFGTAGIAVYSRVRRSLELKAEKALEIRLTWMESSLDLDGRFLTLEARQEPNDGADGWRIATLDGQTLWSSPASGDEIVTKSHPLALGPAARGKPADAAVISLRRADPGVCVTANAEKDRESYYLPAEGSGVDLVLSASRSEAAAHAELSRLRWALFTVGPAFLFGLSLLVAWLIRWQLSPLAEMARQASEIGPGSGLAKIGPVGTGAECVQLRAAINDMVGRLNDALDREKQFVNDASHELRTPLAQMRTQIEVALRRERTPQEYREVLAGAMRDIEQLQRMIAGFLEMARLEGGEGKRTAVPLREILDGALRQAGLDAAVAENSARVADVEGDPRLIGSALSNVLENAGKYAPGSVPRVVVGEEGSHVTVSVIDAGPGVPESERQRIFEPLVRLDSARTDGSFGLGLAIARKAVRACGGDLFCRARSDGRPGAEFVLQLRKAGLVSA